MPRGCWDATAHSPRSSTTPAPRAPHLATRGKRPLSPGAPAAPPANMAPQPGLHEAHDTEETPPPNRTRPSTPPTATPQPVQEKGHKRARRTCGRGANMTDARLLSPAKARGPRPLPSHGLRRSGPLRWTPSAAWWGRRGRALGLIPSVSNPQGVGVQSPGSGCKSSWQRQENPQRGLDLPGHVC